MSQSFSTSSFRSTAIPSVICPTPIRSGGIVYDLTMSPPRPSPQLMQARITMLESECNEFKKRDREQSSEIQELKKSVTFLFDTVQFLKEQTLKGTFAEIPKKDAFTEAFHKTPPPKPESLVPPPHIRRSSVYPVWTVPAPKQDDDRPTDQRTAAQRVSDLLMSTVLNSPPRNIPELTMFPSPGSVTSVRSARSLPLLDMKLPGEL